MRFRASTVGTVLSELDKLKCFTN